MPLAHEGDTLDACVVFISHRREHAEQSIPDVLAATGPTRAFCLGTK
ncbi:hypothetical protein [Streptomyces scopuliridis]